MTRSWTSQAAASDDPIVAGATPAPPKPAVKSTSAVKSMSAAKPGVVNYEKAAAAAARAAELAQQGHRSAEGDGAAGSGGSPHGKPLPSTAQQFEREWASLPSYASIDEQIAWVGRLPSEHCKLMLGLSYGPSVTGVGGAATPGSCVTQFELRSGPSPLCAFGRSLILLILTHALMPTLSPTLALTPGLVPDAPMFKESLTEATLCSLLLCAHQALGRVQPSTAPADEAVTAVHRLLDGLSSTRRFEMLLMFLDERQKAVGFLTLSNSAQARQTLSLTPAVTLSSPSS